MLLLLLCSLAFVAGGVLMIRDGALLGWLVAGFFGLCAVVFATMLLPSSSYLDLDAEGFTVCSLYRRHRTAWRHVDHFRAGGVMGNAMVMYCFVEGYVPQATLRRFNRELAGGDAGLPDSYGMGVEGLASLMNDLLRDYRARTST